MRRTFHSLSLLLALTLAAGKAYGFSLLGPTPAWQTTQIGYVDFVNIPNDVHGGPMNLGEGYRWNVPTIYYSFSPDFLHYFGERGAAEVDKAMAILNALPSMDSVNVDSFPLQSMRMNYRAAALGLQDLKSMALTATVNDLGLTDPTRYIFTLRNRFIIANTTNYLVIRRNFDPVTFEPSSFINGQLWTYTTIFENLQNEALTANEPVDPLALGGLINAPVTSQIASLLLARGGFWTGLTRDDVGGLRYLYRSSNLNVETIPNGVALFIPGTTTTTLGSGSSGSNPWGIPNPTVPGGTTGTGTGTGVPTTTANTNVINTAVRPGVTQLHFTRVNYDSLFGLFPSNTVGYTDSVITNSTKIEQSVVRPLLAPDILFDARDLQAGDANQAFTPYFDTFLLAQNNDAINGTTGNDGPGQFQPTGTTTPAFAIAFNKVGPSLYNFTPSFLSEANSFNAFTWGSFDGSTNAPVVYPNGASILALEEAALSGSGGAGGGGTVSLVSPWTPADQVFFPPGTTTGGTTTGTGTGTGTGP